MGVVLTHERKYLLEGILFRWRLMHVRSQIGSYYIPARKKQECIVCHTV